MKQEVSPGVVAVIIVVILAVAGFFLWRSTGARTDSPKEPINMGNMMGKGGQGTPGTAGPPQRGPMMMGGGANSGGGTPTSGGNGQ